jgi:hypothetical protein
MGLVRRITFWPLLFIYLIGAPIGLGLFLMKLVVSAKATTFDTICLIVGLLFCLMALGMLFALRAKIKDQAEQIRQSWPSRYVVVDHSGFTLRTYIIFMVTVIGFAAGAVAGPIWFAVRQYGPGEVTFAVKVCLAASLLCAITAAELIGMMHCVDRQIKEIRPEPEEETPALPAAKPEAPIEEEPAIAVEVTYDNLGHYFATIPGGSWDDLTQLQTVVNQLCNDGRLLGVDYHSNTEDYVPFRLGAFVNQLPQVDPANPGVVCDLIGELIERKLVEATAS